MLESKVTHHLPRVGTLCIWKDWSSRANRQEARAGACMRRSDALKLRRRMLSGFEAQFEPEIRIEDMNIVLPLEIDFE